MTTYANVSANAPGYAPKTWANRKQRRAFAALYRRRKLRLFAPLTHPETLAFIALKWPQRF